MKTDLHVFYGTCPGCIDVVPCTNFYISDKHVRYEEIKLHHLLSRKACVAFVSELTLFEYASGGIFQSRILDRSPASTKVTDSVLFATFDEAMVI